MKTYVRFGVLWGVLFLASTYPVFCCDTWVAMQDATVGKRVLFAKNSDRTVADCQPLFFHPRQQWPQGATIDLGRLAIPQFATTYATLGSSPYWCWGYEEGINEYGVVIGNEGVFTQPLVAAVAAAKAGPGPKVGPTGMDLVRLGLERGRTAREALEAIVALVEAHGQFGPALPAMGLEGAYDNSFLIADAREAWILETAGTRWATRKVARGVASISNALSLGRPEKASRDLESYAAAQGWWKPGEPFDFAAVYRATGPEQDAARRRALNRAGCSQRLLQEKLGAVDPAWMRRIARDRSTEPALDLDVTASSCVAVLPSGAGRLPVFWWCPAVPSGGVFLPFFVHGAKLPDIVSAPGTAGRQVVAPDRAAVDRFSADSLWWLFRKLNDLVNDDRPARQPVVRATFDEMERQFEAGLPPVLEKAAALRQAGRSEDAAALLDAYSAACVAQAADWAKALAEDFARDAAPLPADLDALAGTYLATFGPFNEAEWVVARETDRLSLTVPGQPALELKPPDKEGVWRLAVSGQAGVSFLRDPQAGVFALKYHRGALSFELPKKGVVLPPVVPLEQLRHYCGFFFGEKLNETLEVLVRNNALFLKTPGKAYELRAPDADGLWRYRVMPVAAIRFETDAAGEVTGFTYFEDGATLPYRKVPPPSEKKE